MQLAKGKFAARVATADGDGVVQAYPLPPDLSEAFAGRVQSFGGAETRTEHGPTRTAAGRSTGKTGLANQGQDGSVPAPFAEFAGASARAKSVSGARGPGSRRRPGRVSGAAPLNASRGPVTLSLAGDIYLGSGVEARLQEMGASAFAAVVPLLKADLVVGNLETPVVTHAQVNANRGGMKSRADLSDALFALGFDVFCLANNHTMDCGADGMHETMALLDQRGVRHYGAGDNLAAARQPLIIERCGLRLGFLGYSQPELDSAEPAAAGVAPLRRSLVLADIAAVRPTVDALVVSLHEGFEFSDYPRVEFVHFCREAVEAGATVIYGHHPHVPHGVEFHRGGLILYSVGNFIFDLPYHREHRWTRQCAIARVTLDGRGVAALEFRPVVLGPDHLPRPATADEAREILARLAELSAPLADLEFIRRKNGEFVNEVMRVILSAPYQFGQQNNATAQEFFWKRQIYRWPYAKAFTDFATLVAGYEPLA